MEKEYHQAIAEALLQSMEKDKNVFILGEGVSDSTGIFGTTLLANKKFPERVVDTPISEALITGLGTGAALTGMRPIMVHARNDFLYLAMDQIANQAALWSYMHGGGIKIPWVIRAIIGRGWGNAAQHSQSLQALFAHIPGLKVVMPSTPFRAKGLLISAIQDDSPVIFLEHRSLYHINDFVPEDYYSLPLSDGYILRKGKDVSLIALSYMTQEAEKASSILEQYGISAEIIDVSSLKPLDKEMIIDSVKKTGRAIILDTGWKSFGASAEISAIIYEDAFDFLKKPVKRIALPDLPVPCSCALEKLYYPGVNEIIDASFDMLDLKNLSREKIKEEIKKSGSEFQGPF